MKLSSDGVVTREARRGKVAVMLGFDYTSHPTKPRAYTSTSSIDHMPAKDWRQATQEDPGVSPEVLQDNIAATFEVHRVLPESMKYNAVWCYHSRIYLECRSPT